MKLTRTYLDWNASAPMRAEAREAVLRALAVDGNPSSVHAEGRRAHAVVEIAREQVAALVHCRPSEIVFTSGATEANNAVFAKGWDNVAVSAIEHPSVLAPAESSRQLTLVGVSPEGVANVEEYARWAASGGAGRLASLQAANNETGVVQPVAELASLACEMGFALHVDATQAPGRLPIDFSTPGITLMSLSSHKIGGPKGAGALIMRDGVQLLSYIRGGSQERRRRAGTENVAAIAGFGAAAVAALAEVDRIDRQRQLRDALEREVKQVTPRAVVIGAPVERLANTTCLALAGQSAETLVIKLDLAGVAVSAGAACSSGKVGSSHVLEAMGLAPEIARSAIRVSIGPETTADDIAAFTRAWARVCSGSEARRVEPGAEPILHEVS